jgi:hypothetical protein
LVDVIADGGQRESLGGMRERVFGVVDRDGHEVRVTLGDCLRLSEKWRGHRGRSRGTGHQPACTPSR